MHMVPVLASEQWHRYLRQQQLQKEAQSIRSDLLDFELVQINVWDPDGNHIHVDFPADE